MILRSAFLAFLTSVLVPASSSVHATTTDGSGFDYVVVGGGLAGVVVASRLSENPNYSVLLVEAGDFEYNNPNVTTTTTLGLGQGTKVDWAYKSIPQVSTNGRNITSRSGKGLGGGTLINGRYTKIVNNCMLTENRNDIHASCSGSDRLVAITWS